MSSLSSILARVEQEVRSKHSEIVIGVFAHLCKKHNALGTCGCEYCQKLRPYVEARMRLTYLKKRASDDYWVSYSGYDIDADIVRQKTYVRLLKIEKDALKVVHQNL